MIARILYSIKHGRDDSPKCGCTAFDCGDKEVAVGDYVKNISRFKNRLAQITAIVDGEVFATGERLDGSDIVTRKIGESVELNGTRGAWCATCVFSNYGHTACIFSSCVNYLTKRRRILAIQQFNER